MYIKKINSFENLRNIENILNKNEDEIYHKDELEKKISEES